MTLGHSDGFPLDGVIHRPAQTVSGPSNQRAASWSRSISLSVRYSRGQSSVLGALRGTVRFTMVDGACLRTDFAM